MNEKASKAHEARPVGRPRSTAPRAPEAGEAALLAAVDQGLPVERQHKGIDGWRDAQPQDVIDAIAAGDCRWFRVKPDAHRLVVLDSRPSVIVYGPAGCGKSRNAVLLGEYFGLARSRDLDERIGVLPRTGTLFLTTRTPDELIRRGVVDKIFRRMYPFDMVIDFINAGSAA